MGAFATSNYNNVLVCCQACDQLAEVSTTLSFLMILMSPLKILKRTHLMQRFSAVFGLAMSFG